MIETIRDGEVGAFADFDNRYMGSGIERKALDQLPIIDMAPFADDRGSPEARRQVAGQIREACVNIGFFYLSGHGISRAELDELNDIAFRFFALPLDTKMTVHAGKSPERQGFMQVGGVNPEANPDKAADMKERFMMAREVEPGEPTEGRYSAGASQWPEPDVLPGFESFMKAHLERRIDVGRRLLHALAMSLDLAPDYFDAAHRYMGCAMALNYYPPFPKGEPLPSQWSFSPHTDYGTLTLLSQDDLGGLQVRNMDGEWIDVQPVPGAFVVNIGDLLSRWTNDLYASNLHRVFNVKPQPRMSVPFFMYPNGMAEVSCIETCQGPGNPARYEPVLAGEYMQMLIEQSSRSGRPGVSKQTASRMKAR